MSWKKSSSISGRKKFREELAELRKKWHNLSPAKRISALREIDHTAGIAINFIYWAQSQTPEQAQEVYDTKEVLPIYHGGCPEIRSQTKRITSSVTLGGQLDVNKSKVKVPNANDALALETLIAVVRNAKNQLIDGVNKDEEIQPLGFYFKIPSSLNELIREVPDSIKENIPLWAKVLTLVLMDCRGYLHQEHDIILYSATSEIDPYTSRRIGRKKERAAKPLDRFKNLSESEKLDEARKHITSTTMSDSELLNARRRKLQSDYELKVENAEKTERSDGDVRAGLINYFKARLKTYSKDQG